MANSQYQYVRKYETDDTLLPNCWLICRVDGRSFHKFSDVHEFAKPNDDAALKLMNKAAMTVLEEFDDVILAYGQSDEYSFLLHRGASMYQRRNSKIVTAIVSIFSGAYVLHWNQYFPSKPLQYLPSFDGRMVLYPTDKNLRDYLSWRQVDCHINNLYNTTFWKLVMEGGMDRQAAEKLINTEYKDSAAKNELLFSKFQTNYNDIPAIYRKGTTLYKKKVFEHRTEDVNLPPRSKTAIFEVYCDLIRDHFWKESAPHLLRPIPEWKLKKPKKAAVEAMNDK